MHSWSRHGCGVKWYGWRRLRSKKVGGVRREATEVKCATMKASEDAIPVRLMCWVLRVSLSGYLSPEQYELVNLA